MMGVTVEDRPARSARPRSRGGRARAGRGAACETWKQGCGGRLGARRRSRRPPPVRRPCRWASQAGLIAGDRDPPCRSTQGGAPLRRPAPRRWLPERLGASRTVDGRLYAAGARPLGEGAVARRRRRRPEAFASLFAPSPSPAARACGGRSAGEAVGAQGMGLRVELDRLRRSRSSAPRERGAARLRKPPAPP